MSSSMSPNGRLMRTTYLAISIVLGLLLSHQGIDGFWTTSISTPPPSSFHHRLIGGGAAGAAGAAGAGTGTATATATTTATRTELRIHQFNGGYDASKAQIVTWNPLQAAEFVIWQHIGTDSKEAGRQLTPLIQDWTGTEVGEFLMRLYLGEKKETHDDNNNDNNHNNTNNKDRNDLKLSFESKHVRTPQWKGLEDEGLIALLDLLGEALPDRVLEPAEIARFAKSFLLKEHTWPITAGGDGDDGGGRSNKDLQKDTFASMGHTANLAKLFGCLRMERFGDFTAKDVLEMVLLPEQQHNNSDHPHESESGFLQMHDFFQYIGIRLAPSEKVDIVQGMAQGGWGPAYIASFVSNIDDIPESHRVRRTIKIPTTRSPASDRGTRWSRSETEGSADDDDDKPKETPTPFYLGATYAYLSANNVEANGNPQPSPFS